MVPQTFNVTEGDYVELKVDGKVLTTFHFNSGQANITVTVDEIIAREAMLVKHNAS